ncbi:MAG: hypothetical protein LIO79_05125, partial [Rikenellaceae bacterium]|nr:hypothetical protein [Rikenellaceae bacterium]
MNKNTTSNYRQFIKSYWEYYLELEDEFLDTKRFVEFDRSNAKSYSIEYLKLYQAVCSEIDVVGKEIAVAVNPLFKIDKYTDIKKWGYEVQQQFPTLKETVVIFNDMDSVQPFKDWEYEKYTTVDKNGKKRTGLRIKDKKETITWWRNYNEIKHRRIGLVEGTKNFQLANQRNLIQALSALFIL